MVRRRSSDKAIRIRSDLLEHIILDKAWLGALLLGSKWGHQEYPLGKGGQLGRMQRLGRLRW